MAYILLLNVRRRRVLVTYYADMAFLAPTWLTAAAAVALFAATSLLPAGSWDALGMGFMKIRFRIWHLYVALAMGLWSLGRGGLNGRFLAIVGALLAVHAGLCYVAAALVF